VGYVDDFGDVQISGRRADHVGLLATAPAG
jgi:hypothetical protein